MHRRRIVRYYASKEVFDYRGKYLICVAVHSSNTVFSTSRNYVPDGTYVCEYTFVVCMHGGVRTKGPISIGTAPKLAVVKQTLVLVSAITHARTHARMHACNAPSK